MLCPCFVLSMEILRTHSLSTSAPTKAFSCRATKSLCLGILCQLRCESLIVPWATKHKESIHILCPKLHGKVPLQCFVFSSVCRPPAGLNFIDHLVGNQPDDHMVPISDWQDCIRERTLHAKQTHRTKGQVNTNSRSTSHIVGNVGAIFQCIITL